MSKDIYTSYRPEHGFVAVDLAFQQCDSIREMLLSHQITPLEVGKFHVTIAYDKDLGQDAIPVEMDPTALYEGKVVAVELLGKVENGLQSAIALVLEAPQLEEQHNRFLSAGYNHGWDTYKAHMSVAYDVPVEEAERMVDVLQVFVGQTFYFDNLHTEEVN